MPRTSHGCDFPGSKKDTASPTSHPPSLLHCLQLRQIERCDARLEGVDVDGSRGAHDEAIAEDERILVVPTTLRHLLVHDARALLAGALHAVVVLALAHQADPARQPHEP